MSYKGCLLTPDTVAALSALEKAATAKKWRLRILGPSPSAPDGDAVSLIPAGREVWFDLKRSDVGDLQTALNAAWGFAVPLGFTPLNRHPLSTGMEDDNIFHFFGPWQAVYDRLLAEGRGELAWPSVCAAAQVDVGAWKGDKADERFVQAQLHRIGRNPGPVDGVIGPRTASALETLGLDRPSLAQTLLYLKGAHPSPVPKEQQSIGHLYVPHRKMVVSATGAIRVQQAGNTAVLHVTGAGRLIVDIGAEEGT